MASFRNLSFFIWACVFLTLVVVTVRVNGERLPRQIATPGFGVPIRSLWDALKSLFSKSECDVNACPGPIAHYRSLNCTPVQEDGYCCASRYDCSHLYEKPTNKCYVNNHEYEIGEHLRREDAKICEVADSCQCKDKRNGLAEFSCSKGLRRKNLCPPLKYMSRFKNTTCYPILSVNQCCPEEGVCREWRPLCRYVDGTRYLEGQLFVPKTRQDMLCVCKVDITGAHFSCAPSKRWFWSDIHASGIFFSKCAPVYYEHEENSNMIGVNRRTRRCQQADDEVTCVHGLRKEVHGPEIIVPDIVKGACDGWWGRSWFNYSCTQLQVLTHRCIYGNWTMHVGDKLNNIVYRNNSCIVCTCEVPPVPTCLIKDKTFC